MLDSDHGANSTRGDSEMSVLALSVPFDVPDGGHVQRRIHRQLTVGVCTRNIRLTSRVLHN